jgi:hypothetical protein
VTIDAELNADAQPDCELGGDSVVRTVVIRAREELVAARATRALLAGS